MPSINQDPSKKNPEPVEPPIDPATGKPTTQPADASGAGAIDSDNKDVGEDEGEDKGGASNLSPRTSNPEGFGGHEPGKPDVPEENNRKPGHDGQPDPDKKDVVPGSDADADDEALGVERDAHEGARPNADDPPPPAV